MEKYIRFTETTENTIIPGFSINTESSEYHIDSKNNQKRNNSKSRIIQNRKLRFTFEDFRNLILSSSSGKNVIFLNFEFDYLEYHLYHSHFPIVAVKHHQL